MAMQSNFFQIFLGSADLDFYWIKSHKYLCTRCILLKKTMVQFLCIYLTRGRCKCAFSKILLIVTFRLVVNGFAQNFYTRYILLEETVVLFACIYLARRRCHSVFQKFSASVPWNRTKFYLEYTYSKRWHWCNFCDYTLLGCAKNMFLWKFAWES